jgi:hypothetical protein
MDTYFSTGILQLFITGVEDDILNSQPSVTYFKYAYKSNGLFYKDDYYLQDIMIKWNDTYYYKFSRDIEYLGPFWLKVTIPYFQIVENTTNIITTTTNSANINEIIYDNHDTFLIIVDSIYYLVPDIFFKSPGIKYNLSEIKFADIKQYFSNIASINIEGDTFIQLLTFLPENYSTDIIPLLLNQGNPFDKLMLSNIIENNGDEYKKNLLTQASFDLYLSNKIEDRLINNYMDINKFDNNDYSIINQEVDYYYNYYLKSIYIYNPPIELDLVRSYKYSLTAQNLTISTNELLKQTITMNSLILQYFLTSICPSQYNTYNFYRKFSTTIYPYSVLYNFTILNSDIIDYKESVATNLINQYYPQYYVNINSINSRLPFVLTISMVLNTLTGKNIIYTIEGSNNVFTITDTNPINLYELPITINPNPNINTENVVDTTIINPDTNINTEWDSNLTKGLTNLHHNSNIQMYLFNNFLNSYHLQETTIKNNFVNFTDTDEIITNLWIELNTIITQYNKNNTPIGFNNTNTFTSNKNIIADKYKYIVSIQTIPMDMALTYAICINQFIENISTKYFYNDTFLTFFYNKINNGIYQRYNRISNLPQTNIAGFNGLLFYYNIDLKEYISKQQIQNYLTELFNMSTFLCYIDNSANINNPNLLVANDVLYYTDDNTFLSPSKCFQELKTITTFIYDLSKIKVNGSFISIDNDLITTNGLVTYNIICNDILYTNVSFTVINNTIIFNLINPIDIVTISIDMIIITPIPLISISDSYNNNNTHIVTVFDTNQQINLFEQYNRVNIIINSNSIIIITYTLSESDTVVIASYDSTNNILVSDQLITNYSDYDTITITIINLACQYMEITNNDTVVDISISYPYIELNKLSDVYTSNFNYFTSLNTIKTNDGLSIRITNETNSILTLYVTDTNSYYSDQINIISMDNSYLPNLLNYTSLNPNINSSMDYMIQKPFIINISNIANAPIYCIANAPITPNKKIIMYINNVLVYNIYQMNSDQLLRDTILYPTHYYDGLAKIDNSYDIVLSQYKSVFTGIYEKVIQLIESSQASYYDGYYDMIKYIDMTTRYGTTINTLYNTIIPLNSMNYTNSTSSYLISPTRYDITNYDVYTNLALSLYNFTNTNNKVIITDTKMLTIMSNKYILLQQQLINSPWQKYNSSFKLSDQLLDYLSNYSLYGQRMLKTIDDNSSLLKITNSSNFPQNFSKEYIMRYKYINLVYDISRVDIELLYPNPWSDILQNTLDDDFSVTWMKDTIVNVDSKNILYTTNTPSYIINHVIKKKK